MAILHEPPAFPLWNQPQRFDLKDLAGREGVVKLDDVHILRADTGHLVGLSGGKACVSIGKKALYRVAFL